MNVMEKAEQFLVALSDAYLEEEDRELCTFPALNPAEVSEDDFTAMLIAMKVLFEEVTGEEGYDLIGFTHLLNRFAIQHIMETGDEHCCCDCGGDCDCDCDCYENNDEAELAAREPTELQ